MLRMRVNANAQVCVCLRRVCLCAVSVSSPQWPPYIIYSQDDNGVDVYTGFCVDLLNILAAKLNFR